MVLALLAATYTFTATATGVEKGTAVEFAFAGHGTDRDYETMFLIDQSVDEFCQGLEKAGFPRGKPTDAANCRFWPVGCPVRLDPALESFVTVTMPEGMNLSNPVYTGGTRIEDGSCEAATNMPSAVFSLFTLAQSPIVFNGIYDQGAVYGSFTAKEKIEKGKRVTFKLSCDETLMPRTLLLTMSPGEIKETLSRIRAESEKGDLDVQVDFDGTLSVKEATAVANALAAIDSPRVKINGRGNIFYRSFLPPVKWLDRRERLTQPFELTLGNPDKLIFIDEDWSVDGDDPELTPTEIQFSDAKHYPKTDTCFIYTPPVTPVSRILKAMSDMKGSNVHNWYVFAGE